jgi:glyoxylase-like metal-dependent hydrolase (beta-lactamase superfamily II)
MAPVEILEDLFFIERGYLNGNHFVYRGEEPVLIDTAYADDFGRTEELIRYVGVDPARVKLIVNTHCHCDHVGGARIIQDRSGCEVAMHVIGKRFIDTGDDWSTWWRYYEQRADFFHCSRGLENGQTIAIGPHEFEVIYTPGHSADGIVLYNQKEKVLISSDTLWEKDMAVLTVRVEGSRAPFSLMESLDTLEKLDVKTVYPGHGRPFTDMSGAISKARNRLLEYMTVPKKMGNDLLKKIIVYTLMMKNGADEGTFFQDLTQKRWFVETIDLYFDGDLRRKYDDTMKSLFRRGIIKYENQRITTSAKR